MKDCWIKPDGTIVNVRTCGHNEYAEEFLIKEMGEDIYYDTYDHYTYPYQVLHKRGWVRVKVYTTHIVIVGDCIDLTKPMRNTMDPAMNISQMKTAKCICDEFGVEFHNAINDKRFW